MKEQNNGAFAPASICVYTFDDLATVHRYSPVLADRLRNSNGASCNRLILSRSLFEGTDHPSAPDK
jgi:hypothetical protein